jgi:cell division protease FtsH
VCLAIAACAPAPESISYSTLKQRVAAGDVAEVAIGSDRVEATPTAAARDAGAPAAWTAVPPPSDESLLPLLERHGVEYGGENDRSHRALLLLLLLPLVLVPLWIRGHRFMGRWALGGVGRLGARDARDHDDPVHFGDVAGIDEAKEELLDVVRFLQEPDAFAAVGARIPRGVLLVGPPGTGKTLLARAVAGEAGVPFFSISATEFMEVYVGVGAARVRELFRNARKASPCIVFIDEIDAVAKTRSSGGRTGNDERDQTLNQLLVEMDGFSGSTGVVVMAATNRPDVLDSALLRPGRFDRRVAVHPPDRAGRQAILSVHARRIRLGADVDLADVAERTPGFAGADLANLLNEGALLAARGKRLSVEPDDLEAALDRVLAGLERKSGLIDPKERRIVAIHEAGHALVAERVPTAGQVQKISILPRSIGALGFTRQLPDDRTLFQHDELLDRLAVLLGGRAAEQAVLAQVSTGAASDLERATKLARRMVCEFGMSTALGPVRYAAAPASAELGDGEWGAAPGDDTAQLIDREVRAILAAAAERADGIVAAGRGALDAITAALLERETLDRTELLEILAV